MSDSHRRENHSPVPCWNAEADLGQRDAPGDAPAAASGDWLLLLPLSAGAVALDLGCGDGALSLELAHYCDQVVAVDAEPANVEATRRRASDAGLSHLQACRGNLDALISARRRFDLVVVRDPRRALAGVRPAQAVERLAELVAPQGCLAIAVGNPPEALCHGNRARERVAPGGLVGNMARAVCIGRSRRLVFQTRKSWRPCRILINRRSFSP